MMTEDRTPANAADGQSTTSASGEAAPKPAGTPKQAKEPPPGSRKAKLARLKREHPRLYASRHVAIAVGEVAVGLLGLKALLSAFLPRIDLSWIPLPDINLPDFDPPALINPIGWLLSRIPWPDLDVPGWITAVVQSGKAWAPIVVPIAIAVLVALGEVDKRRRRQRASDQAASGTTTPAGSDDRSGDTGRSDR